MNDHLNFLNVVNAFMALIRVATGESWNDLMDSLMLEYTLHNQCNPNPTYESFKENNYKPVGCGLPFTVMAYFYSYILIVSVTFLNLFIAVILDGYFTTVEGEKNIFNHTKLEKFRTAWASQDPRGLGFINKSGISKLLLDLGEPLGWDKSFKGDFEK
jgi:hypothetical protein